MGQKLLSEGSGMTTGMVFHLGDIPFSSASAEKMSNGS